MRNSIIIYPVKIEYVSEVIIFALKMMMKSGLGKRFLTFFHAQNIFRLIDLLHKV